ncbi:zinc-dependent metalloprotease [Leptolyngbya sp. FACHB-17]|uniref:zinc-dependent metalloprotease n=1 Tax=unclassified Leptolyngbya TaxID=2650499 RepID=UPI001F552FAC|nr:zinc-dependent metalloprotease [Leptolyngbya sp. FACHB-17]
MKRVSRFLAFLLGFMLVMLPVSISWVLPGVAESPRSAQRSRTEVDRSQLRPFDEVIKDATPLKGLFTLYRNEKSGKLFAEIMPNQLERNFFAAMTLESGVGERGIYSGLPIGDFLFTLRRNKDSIQFVVPNIYFRSEQGLPIQRSIQRSFSDSILETLPIRSIHSERKSFLVELNPLLLSDLPGLLPVLGKSLGGDYSPDIENSYFDRVKAFPQNIEVETVFGFIGSGNDESLPTYIETLPDSRAFTLKVRYSLSQLPENSDYRPRLADDRIGYFITAYKDYTNDNARRPFVRYINRWNLQKQDPSAPLSKPKKPIVFWIENSVPLEYRDAVRDGVLMWNRTFEKIGFKDAIEVKQMPDKADWDPADVRYNTIRWFNTNDAIFAMGPSRVNPLTGEILDADIIVSADFTRAVKEDYRTIVEQNQMRSAPFAAQLTGNANLCNYGMAAHSLRKQAKADEKKNTARLRFGSHLGNYQDLCFGVDTAKQYAVGNLSLALMQNTLPSSPEMKAFAQEFMRSLIAHEVGHTLGLRHNFRASSMLKPEELNNTAITRSKGLVGSVMEYAPVNLAPQGTKQGDYFTHTVGPYDEWAIEYGYKPITAIIPLAEKRELDKIAQRAPAPELTYATDEDLTYLDPKINVFDMSGDLLTYAQWQLNNARQMWNRVDQRYPFEGDGFNEVRVAFNAVFEYYFQYSTFLSEYIGGQYFNRFKAGDAKGRLPFEPVPIDQQRQALALIEKYVFSEEPFRFSPDFLNKLAPSRWAHWGANPTPNLDYPIHDNILFLQSITLYSLLDYDRLARLRDSELKTQAGQGLTIPELFDSLQSSIWGDVIKPQDNLKLSGLRRALQRQYMEAMISMLLRQAPVPEDARTVARYELRQLRRSIDRALGRVSEKEVYTKAHLEEARDRIAKALDAQLQSQ